MFSLTTPCPTASWSQNSVHINWDSPRSTGILDAHSLRTFDCNCDHVHIQKNWGLFLFLTQLVSKPNPACHHCQQCPSRIDVEYYEEWSKHWHPHCNPWDLYAEIYVWILDSCTNWLCLLSYSPSDLQPMGPVRGFWIATNFYGIWTLFDFTEKKRCVVSEKRGERKDANPPSLFISELHIGHIGYIFTKYK